MLTDRLLPAQRVPKLELGNQRWAGPRDYSPKIRDGQPISACDSRFCLATGWRKPNSNDPVGRSDLFQVRPVSYPDGRVILYRPQPSLSVLGNVTLSAKRKRGSRLRRSLALFEVAPLALAGRAIVTRSVSEGTGCDRVRPSLTLRVTMSICRRKAPRATSKLAFSG